VKIWEVGALREKATLTGHHQAVRSVAFSPDGKLIATGGGTESATAAGEVKLWDATSGQCLAELADHRRCVHWLGFSPKGGSLVTATEEDGALRVCDVTTRKLKTRLAATIDVRAASFNADGGMLATLEGDGSIRLWDTSKWRELAALPGQSARYVALAPDGHAVVSATPTHAVKMWRITAPVAQK
jgi:WD40 repeat protein